MSGGRRLAAVLAVVAVALLSTGSGAFTAAQLDRGMEVNVVEDEEAFLGVEELDPTLNYVDVDGGADSEGEEPSEGAQVTLDSTHEDVELLRLENRFGDIELTAIEARISGDGAGEPDVLGEPSAAEPLSSGDSGLVTVDVECPEVPGETASETWEVTVDAEGSGVAVELTRSVTVTCENGADMSASGESVA